MPLQLAKVPSADLEKLASAVVIDFGKQTKTGCFAEN
jgi:hypothetical protein